MTTGTMAVPGATLTYDIREGSGSSAEPPLLLIGYPMAAAGFVSLASHFTDRTVVTYDPRGSERSTKAQEAPITTPDVVADDLHALIERIGGPVDMFASSGGAVDALALVARYPHDVRKLVAHEPPLFGVLPDSDACAVAVRDIYDTYHERGWGHAMARFMALVMHQGEVPADWTSRPAPDPQMFGMPADDNGQRDDPMFSAIVATTSYQPDFEALKSAPTRIVMAAGGEHPGTMANRGAHGVADRLGIEPVLFPGDHGGFLGGEHGQTGKPTEFAAKLREVLG
jgi:pimeloyl-ACP methyl ester carboxylesterase